MPIALREAVKYILSREGCVHPFRLSRILALAEISYYKSRGKRLTDAVYVLGPGVFYIEGFKELVDEDPCIEKRKGDPEKGVKGCIYLACDGRVELPEEEAKYLDEAIEKAKGVDDFELNNAVVGDEVFREIAKTEG